LPAVEEHEHICHWLGRFLPEQLERDVFNGDEDMLALPLPEIVEPLQHPLSVLQKTHRDALASPLLVASDEIIPLESDDRHPTPSQKLQISKQPTSPAAPALAPPLSLF